MVAHACNPSTLGGRGRRILRSRVQDQPVQYSETPLLQKKVQKLAGHEYSVTNFWKTHQWISSNVIFPGTNNTSIVINPLVGGHSRLPEDRPGPGLALGHLTRIRAGDRDGGLRGAVGVHLQQCLPVPGWLRVPLLSAARVGEQTHGWSAGGLHLAHLLSAQALAPGVHCLSSVARRQVEGSVGAVGRAASHVEREGFERGERAQPSEAQQAPQLGAWLPHQVFIAQPQVATPQPGGRTSREKQVAQPGLADHLEGTSQEEIGARRGGQRTRLAPGASTHTVRQQHTVEAVAPLAGAQHLDALAQQSLPRLEARVVYRSRVAEKLHYLQVEAWVTQQGHQHSQIEQAHVLDDHHRVLSALGLQGAYRYGRAAALAGGVLDEAHLGSGTGRARTQRRRADDFVGPPAEEGGRGEIGHVRGPCSGVPRRRVQPQHGEVAAEERTQHVAQSALQALGVARIQRLP
ncbi:Zinc finger protein 714 [Plecturocebus cupreus]